MHDNKDSKKPARKRNDPRQTKPAFHEFVKTWGLPVGGDPGDEARRVGYELNRIYNGVYLHPDLKSWIEALQVAFQNGFFPSREKPHPLSPGPKHSVEDGHLISNGQRILQAQRSGSRPSELELDVLKCFNSYYRAMQSQWRRLAKAMLSAAACGDFRFFEHVALILRCLATGDSKTLKDANSRAVIEAIKSLVYARAQDPGCPKNFRYKDALLDWNQIDDEIIKNPRILEIVPSWPERQIEARQKLIERASKAMGWKLQPKALRPDLDGLNG